MSWTLRSVEDTDWDEILRVADEAAPYATGGNDAWVRARRAFDASRRHYVAVSDTGRIDGYCAAEDGDGAGRCRVYIVTEATRLRSLGEAMLDRVMREIAEMGARVAWMREEASDAALLAFAREHGFSDVSRYDADVAGQRVPLVVLERPVFPRRDSGTIV